MPINRAKILSLGRAIGDQSSLTGFLGEAQGLKERAWARGVGATAGRLQAKLGVFGLVGMGLLFNWLARKVKEQTSEPLWVGTAVKYGHWLNQGKKHIPKKPWWDVGVERAKRKLSGQGEFDLLGHFAEPPTSLNRSGLYQGQQFISDVRSALTGGLFTRLISRFAGSASARLFMGALVNRDINSAMIPAITVQRECMKAIKWYGLVDTGCLINSVAIGATKQEMLMKSRRGCLAALAQSSESTIKDKQNYFIT